MTTSYRDWQPGHVKLSAPSLQLLRNGPAHDADEEFSLALRELVGLGLLIPTILQSGEGSEAVHTTAFTVGQPAPDGLERSLQSVLDAYATAAVGGGTVTVQEVAHALRAKHDGKLTQWVEDDVLAVLIDRKFYEKKEGKRFGIIPTSSTDLTAEGRAIQAQLEASIERVEDQWDGWASDDSRRAQTFLDLAGSAVLLMPDLHTSIAQFRASQTGGSSTSYPADSVASVRGPHGFDVDRLVLYANELRVMDDVIVYTHLDVDEDNDETTRT
jgi:hypothetical protein